MFVNNAVIMAAGTSSRFAPLSYEKPKGLIEVKGEVLIERQIRQLREAGVRDIYVVTGYLAEQFAYLISKYDVKIVYNQDYLTRNNNASIWAVRDILKNTYICSADNYFAQNPFEKKPEDSYYASVYAEGYTKEWCLKENVNGYISSVNIGGYKSWYMIGHTFWSEEFSRRFFKILEAEYYLPETAGKLWEEIYVAHLDVLKMKIRKYNNGDIYEFDTLDELRSFDGSYQNDSRSTIMRNIADSLKVSESEIVNINAIKGTNASVIGFDFNVKDKSYRYFYQNKQFILL